MFNFNKRLLRLLLLGYFGNYDVYAKWIIMYSIDYIIYLIFIGCGHSVSNSNIQTTLTSKK